MPSTTNPSMSRRRQCLYQLHHSIKNAGSSTMDTKMAESLGVTITSSDRELHTPIPSPTLSASYEDVNTVYMDSYEIACYLRDYIDELPNSDGTSKFLEWPYVHHLSTYSNSPGCSSLTTSGLEIAFVSGTHTGAVQPLRRMSTKLKLKLLLLQYTHAPQQTPRYWIPSS
jgi:hypothetical protein